MTRILIEIALPIIGFAAGWGWSRLKPAQRSAVTDTIASGAQQAASKASDQIKKL
jgi:hypothetical protein